MRRLAMVCSLAMLAVCVSPVPAHAYFWEWLDSLSGPKFAGASVEVKVWCQTDRRDEVIKRVRDRLAARSGPYRTTLSTLSQTSSVVGLEFMRRGVIAADMVELLLKQTEASVNYESDAERYDPSELFFEALRWRDYAYTQFVWVERAEEAARTRSVDISEEIRRAALLQGFPTPRALKKTKPRAAAFAGLSFSVCPAEALDRHKRSLNLSVGYGWDQKDANQAANNRMLTFGASYNFVVAPWLTLGFGAGGAHFTSDTAESFTKAFVQPWIIDVRPFALRQKAYSPDAWEQVWFVRISSITFPGGFDAGQFTGSPKLPTELVHSIGIHADLDPLIRKARLRW